MSAALRATLCYVEMRLQLFPVIWYSLDECWAVCKHFLGMWFLGTPDLAIPTTLFAAFKFPVTTTTHLFSLHKQRKAQLLYFICSVHLLIQINCKYHYCYCFHAGLSNSQDACITMWPQISLLLLFPCRSVDLSGCLHHDVTPNIIIVIVSM